MSVHESKLPDVEPFVTGDMQAIADDCGVESPIGTLVLRPETIERVLLSAIKLQIVRPDDDGCVCKPNDPCCLHGCRKSGCMKLGKYCDEHRATEQSIRDTLPGSTLPDLSDAIAEAQARYPDKQLTANAEETAARIREAFVTGASFERRRASQQAKGRVWSSADAAMLDAQIEEYLHNEGFAVEDHHLKHIVKLCEEAIDV